MLIARKSRTGIIRSKKTTTIQGPCQINLKKDTAGTAKQTHTWRKTAGARTLKTKPKKAPVTHDPTTTVPT
jgi:hypothetical protein